MIIKFIPNQFDKKDRKELDIECSGKTVKQYLRKHFKKSTKDLACVVSGKRVEWDHIPCKDDEVIFVNDLQGGGWLGAIFGAVLTVVGIVTQQYWLAGIGVSMMVGGIMGAMGMFAPTMPDAPSKNSFDSSQTYSWDGIRNLVGEGNVVPVVYGKHRIGGALIEGFIDGESNNGTQARKYLNALFAISEGPIHGIDDTTIQINKQLLSQYDEDVEYWTRDGDISQSAISNFSKVVRHYAMTSTINLTQGNGYVYKTYNVIDKAKVTVSVPGLFKIDDDGSDAGEMKSLSVQVSVYYSSDLVTPNWILGREATVTGKTKSALEEDILINFPAKGQYLLKIERDSVDWTSDPNKNGLTHLKAISEIEKAKCSYPATALYGVRLKATDKLSGAMPTFTCEAVGRAVEDVRDASITQASARNPANIIYDMLTNERYGLGKWVGEDNIDLASFQEYANWCDEMVDHDVYDQKTGQTTTVSAKRYKMDLVLDTDHRAIDLIAKLCASTRVIPYWSGNKLKMVIEKPQSVYAQKFNMANIVKNSFEETYVGLNNIPTQVEAQFLDADNDYKRMPVIAVDKTRLDEPTNSKAINLYGLTKSWRVKRECIFALKKAKGLRKAIKFEGSIDAIICEVGDLMLFQHDIPQYGYGGNITSIATEDVYLDRNVPLVGGTECILRVRKKDGTDLTYQWTPSATLTTNIINVPGLTGVERGDLWFFGPVGKEAKPFRILSIGKASKNKFTLTAEEYNESIFNEDEDIEVTNLNYSLLGLTAEYDVDGNPVDPGEPTIPPGPEDGSNEMPPLVLDVNVFEELKLVGNTYRSDIVVNFTPVEMSENSPARITKYKVIYSTDSGVTWKVDGETTGAGYYRIVGAEVGTTYYVHVKPYTNFDVTNHIELTNHKLDFGVTPVGKVAPPLAPSNLVVTGGLFLNELEWANPLDKDIDYVEIWCATENLRASAVMVGAAKGQNFTHGNLHSDVTYYYWIRCKDTAGNYSSWFPASDTGGIGASPETDPGRLIDLLGGSISEGMLAQALQDKINDTPDVVSEVQLLKNMWTVKIQEDDYITGCGLALYEDWSSAKSYIIDDYCWGPDSEVYKCLISHTDREPSGNPAYWQLIPYGAKSEFVIQSDKFAIIKPDGSGGIKTPFIVGSIGGVDTVGVDGNLVVDGTITGQKINAQSLIELNEGGKAIFGNDNVIIDTIDDSVTEGRIIIAPNGGIAAKDYVQLDDGDVKNYYYDATAGQHVPYKGLSRVEAGVANNNETVAIPGHFKEQPKIFVAPFQIKTFDDAYSNQDQTVRMQAESIQLQSGETSKWQFKAKAYLDLETGGGGQSINENFSSTGAAFTSTIPEESGGKGRLRLGATISMPMQSIPTIRAMRSHISRTS